jgi:ubiquinone/menaquinone biosynthesis C-methylase UbiE
MVKQRKIEQEGVTGELTVESYDKMMRRLMDKGYLDTKSIIKSGITNGEALEIGPGPGYLGIDWLKNTENTSLKALDISPDMIVIAKRNAHDNGVENRVEYILGDAKQLPFKDETFDAVFTNGSMHEWSNPKEIYNEIYRVLKKGGHYFISDLRRDINFIAKIVLQIVIPKERKKGFLSSLYASYTKDELLSLIKDTKINHSQINTELWSIEIMGKKE